MNYEKAYKEALNKAQSKIENDKGHVLYEDDIKEIFPELKESEDKRISREITEFLVDFNNGEYKRPNENTIDSWLSWLEKQDKQKFAISDDALREGISHFGITQYQIDNWLKKYIDIEKQGEQKSSWDEDIRKALISILKSDFDKDTTIYGISVSNIIAWLEKQGEQKSSWCEKDEKMWAQVINEIEAIKSNSSTIFEKNIAQNKIDWLKSLKYRIGGE